MTSLNSDKNIVLANTLVVDLQAYRSATSGGRLAGRAQTGEGAAHVAPGWRNEADDLADEINRLLDRVGECLALVTGRTIAHP